MLDPMDEFLRGCLAIRIDRRLRSTDVIDALSDLLIPRGLPDQIRSDNSPDFVAPSVRDRIVAIGARTASIEPYGAELIPGPRPDPPGAWRLA